MPSPRELWQDYYFLTQEMSKFLVRNEIDLFFELINQRERLQADIDNCEDNYKRTPEGKALLGGAIRLTNQAISHRLQFLLNQAKQQETVSNAYDYGERPVGNRLDRKS